MGAEMSRAGEPHPRTRLNDNFASPIRFSLMATLGEDLELDFATLTDILQVGDSALSKAISHLHAADYVVARKVHGGGRPRTWVRATSKGRGAFVGHVRALRDIVGEGL